MPRQQNLHASMERLVSKLAPVKYDGRDEPVVIRAAPQQVVAYILNYGGRCRPMAVLVPPRLRRA